jgi:hypothetical protein
MVIGYGTQVSGAYNSDSLIPDDATIPPILIDWAKEYYNGVDLDMGDNPDGTIGMVEVKKEEDTTPISHQNLSTKNNVAISTNGNKLTINNANNFDNLSIYSISGKLLLSKEIEKSNSTSIKISNLSAGSYIVQLKGNSSLVKKILVR